MRIISTFFVLFLIFNAEVSFSQENRNPISKEKKGFFYVYWGYNRSIFSQTNIHFTGPLYDFTIYDVVGHDRPHEFGMDYINPVMFSVPQYNVRFGYFITDRFSISGGMDHMKYVMDQNQTVNISGVISKEASEIYAGSYLDDPIVLTEDFLMFEHTNGFNLITLDAEYLLPIAYILQNKISFHWNFGAGGIWVVTKTDVKVMGDGMDNDFHVAGFTMTAKTGPRIEFFNRFFILGEARGGYASLPNVLIKNDAPEFANHNLTFVEYYFAIGVYFRFKKKKDT